MSEKMRTSIKNKLVTMSVIVSLIAIILLSFVSWHGFDEMKESSDLLSYDLVNLAATDSESLIRAQVLSELSNLAKATANTVDARIQPIMHQVEILAGRMEDLYTNPNSYGRIPIYPADASNQGTFVAQITYADYTDMNFVEEEIGLIGNITSIMNQVSSILPGVNSVHYGTESGLTIMCDDRSDLKAGMGYFDPTIRSWYTNATESGTAAWSEVFKDAYGRGLSITCGHPVYYSNGDIKGVVAIGCQLSDFSSTISDVTVGETGVTIVVDENGAVILGQNYLFDETNFIEDQVNLFDSDDDVLIEAVKKMIAGESGIVNTNIDGKETYLAYSPMQSLPWSVVTLIDVDEVMQPVLEGKAQTTALAILAQEEADRIAYSTLIAMIAGMGASATLALLVGILYSNSIASPIKRLENGVREISKGKLDCKLDIKTGDEIENLAEAFNLMTSDLKHYIDDLTNITAEKERIGAELEVATHIQSSMLPSKFPAFPMRKDFDIYASMIPAKEVGGDFYDFFLIDSNHLGIVMADVSGKGVPAALFMVITKTLIQNYAQKGESPADIMTHTNNQLCQNNDANMFVTAWVGIVNIKTGVVTYTNAGHNPPLIKRSDGEFEYLHTDAGFVLAGLDYMTYEESTINLSQGDILYLYTDGITEATNGENELYSEERLLSKINEYDTKSLQCLLGDIKRDIDNFVGSTPQFDDITMLAFKYEGKK